jgi:hypothetical protein
MTIRLLPSGGASWLDAVLYDDYLAPMSGSLEDAHVRPSDLSKTGTDDRTSTGPN